MVCESLQVLCPWDVGRVQNKVLCWVLNEQQISCIDQVALLKDKKISLVTLLCGFQHCPGRVI